jgi:hypothetical protein
VPLPRLLDTAGLKPWEVGHIDTMQLWKFGDHKAYTSLALLTDLLGIPTPKDDNHRCGRGAGCIGKSMIWNASRPIAKRTSLPPHSFTSAFAVSP